MGYPNFHKKVLVLVRRIVDKETNYSSCYTSGWWQLFGMQAPKSYSPGTCTTFQGTSQRNRFRSYESRLSLSFSSNNANNDLLDKSCKIFNTDEPGMPLDPKQVKRVFECGVENMLVPSSGDKTQITVVACTWYFRQLHATNGYENPATIFP